jgi:ankyrin repeat protein
MAAIPVTGKIIGTNAEQQKNKSDFTVDELVHAAQHGDFPFIETAVEGYNISASLLDSDGCSLMHWACINNRLKIAQFLLGKNIDINYAGGANNETALQWAVRNPGGTELVGFLLAQCQDINIAHKSKYGLDALFIAVQTGNFDIVYLLLVAGADPNTLSNDKDSPLLWLLKTKTDVPRSTDLLRLLLSFQADASKGDRDKNTGLHVLASGSNLKLPFLLFQKGADLDARNNEYLTPSDLAKSAQNYEMQLVLKDIANFVKLPLNFPIFLFAMCFIVWVLSWHFFDWYYVIFLIFPMSLLIFQRFSQR